MPWLNKWWLQIICSHTLGDEPVNKHCMIILSNAICCIKGTPIVRSMSHKVNSYQAYPSFHCMKQLKLFPPPTLDGMLVHHSCTRTQHKLCPSGMAWIQTTKSRVRCTNHEATSPPHVSLGTLYNVRRGFYEVTLRYPDTSWGWKVLQNLPTTARYFTPLLALINVTVKLIFSSTI